MQARQKKLEKEVKKTKGTSHPKKFKARVSNGHHKNYILLLFVGLAHKSTLACFLFFLLSDSRIVSHLPFVCKWQNRFQDSEPIVARFPSNKGATSDIRITRNSSKLHPAPCMRDVCCVHGLDSSRMLKQNVLSLILWILLVKLTNQKKGICRHRILYHL